MTSLLPQRGRLIGMSVDLADEVHGRLANTPARPALDSVMTELRAMAYRSERPKTYGIDVGEDRVLTPRSIARAHSAANSLATALAGIASALGDLRANIDAQRDAERAGTAVNYGAAALTGLFGAGVVREYETRGGTQYGPLFRHPDDPRRHWRNQRLAYNSNYVFTGTNWSSRWINRNALTRAYGAANAFVSRIGSRIPTVLARGLGPIGVVIGFGLSYQDGFQTQIAADAGRGYSEAEAESRAVTRGVATAVGSTVGAVALGIVGGAIGGPIGAAVGGMVGGWLGGVVGGAIGDLINES